MQRSYLPQNIQEVYQGLIDSGFELRVDGNTLRVKPPQEGFTDDVRQIIKRYKPGLISLLNGQKVNDFQECLEKGSNPTHRPFLEAVYQKAFYNLDLCNWTQNGNTQAQKTGSDVVIYLTNDRVVRIDEKIRPTSNTYKDILLEFVSNDRYNTPGWIEKDLGIDYLCYAFFRLKRAYLFPWQQLKQVWIKNKSAWLDLAKNKQQGFVIVRAPNDTYHTLSCAVPTKLLIEKVKGALLITID